MLAHLLEYLKNKIVIIAWGGVVAVLALSFLPIPQVPVKTTVALTAVSFEPNKAAFTNVSTIAKSAIVYNLKTEETIFDKNSQEVKPLASITKLMTALTASDYLTDADQIRIDQKDLAGGSNAGLDKNHTWRFTDLRDYMLTTSSNGAAMALARAASQKATTTFENLMNAKAKSLGLNSLSFTNPTGLTENGRMPVGTAADVALLLKHIYTTKPELLNSTRWSYITKTSVDKRRYLGENTNQIVNSTVGLLASKTGFTDEAGGNLAIIFDAGINNPLATVVLDSTYDGRFTDISALVKAALAYYAH